MTLCILVTIRINFLIISIPSSLESLFLIGLEVGVSFVLTNWRVLGRQSGRGTGDTFELTPWVGDYQGIKVATRKGDICLNLNFPTDADECADGAAGCDDDQATCINEPVGSFTCTCNEGFTGDGTICTGT